MKTILQLKREVIKNIKRIIAPHLWKSGYEGTMIFSFAPLHSRRSRSMGKVFEQGLTECAGFYDDGIIDPWGGGCACFSFWSYCLEDLLAIEKWLYKNFEKELTRSKKYRKLK